jgi:polyisoprenoid-binding protein YceI
MANQRARLGAGGLVSCRVAWARGRAQVWIGALLIGALAWPVPARAGERSLANARVRFTASVSNGPKIVGTGTDLRFESKGGLLIFRVPLSAVTTRKEARDRQMRDRYLEADTHPTVELQMAREALTIPKHDGVFEGDASASLKLHGKSRQTSVHYSVERRGESLKVSGSFRVDLRAHGIDIPSYRGITVRPEVDVEVAFGGIDRAVIADAL